MTTNYISITVNGSRVVNAQQLASQMEVQPDWMDDINSVECESGPNPSYGRFLINAIEYESNWPESGPFNIVITRGTTGVGGSPTTLTLTGYVTVFAQKALRTTNSPMIVTVADIRYLAKQSFSNRAYNVDGGTEAEWPDVLGDLTEDLPADVSGAGLVFGSAPSYPLGRWLIDGMPTLDALAELGSRAGQCLVYNPIEGQLQFKAMSGSQTIPSAGVHREYAVPDTDTAHVIGSVRVSFEREGTAETQSEVSTIGGGNRQAHAWGLQVIGIATPENTTAEATALAGVWAEWSARLAATTVTEYFGAMAISPGSQVSEVSWQVLDSEIFTTVTQGAPPEPETHRSRYYSQGAGHAFVVTNAAIPAAYFSPEFDIYIPGKLSNQPIYVASQLLVVYIGVTEDTATIYNSSLEEVEAGLHRLELIDGFWFVDTGGGGATGVIVKLSESMPGARADSDSIILTPSMLEGQRKYVFNEAGEIVDSGETVTVYNANRNISVEQGFHEAQYINGKLCVSPNAYRGDVECTIEDPDKVIIAENETEVCIVNRVHGPGDEYDTNPEEGQDYRIEVTNPNNLPGWRLLRCRYNYNEEAWEVISTNLASAADGVFDVRLVEVGGDMGNADTRCAFYYDVYGAEPEDAGRLIHGSYQPNDYLDGYQRPNIGAMMAATAGSMTYRNGEFLLRTCNETLCAHAIDFSQFEMVDVPLPLLEW